MYSGVIFKTIMIKHADCYLELLNISHARLKKAILKKEYGEALLLFDIWEVLSRRQKVVSPLPSASEAEDSSKLPLGNTRNMALVDLVGMAVSMNRQGASVSSPISPKKVEVEKTVDELLEAAGPKGVEILNFRNVFKDTLFLFTQSFLSEFNVSTAHQDS